MNWFLKESDNERLIILEHHHSTSHEHLRQRDLRGAVGRVRHRTGCESGVPRCALELGASAAFGTKEHRLGDVSPYHGRVVDLGILLARSCTPGGICRHRCLDSPGRVQFISSLPVDLLSRGRRRNL